MLESSVPKNKVRFSGYSTLIIDIHKMLEIIILCMSILSTLKIDPIKFVITISQLNAIFLKVHPYYIFSLLAGIL